VGGILSEHSGVRSGRATSSASAAENTAWRERIAQRDLYLAYLEERSLSRESRVRGIFTAMNRRWPESIWRLTHHRSKEHGDRVEE
jgi:hypothetical protein